MARRGEKVYWRCRYGSTVYVGRAATTAFATAAAGQESWVSPSKMREYMQETEDPMVAEIVGRYGEDRLIVLRETEYDTHDVREIRDLDGHVLDTPGINWEEEKIKEAQVPIEEKRAIRVNLNGVLVRLRDGDSVMLFKVPRKRGVTAQLIDATTSTVKRQLELTDVE